VTRSLAAAAAALALFACTGTAGTAAPCWSRLLDDWRTGGRIDGTYPIGCYRDAISNLPEDLRQYSSASEDITRAMLLALADRRGGTGPPQAAAAHAARSTVPLRLLALVGAALGLVLALSAVGRVLKRRRAKERHHLGSAE
jgi:hypothetical protein